MSSFFDLVLDTLAPSGVALLINNGATYTTSANVNLAISTTDEVTTDYQMKIWGTSTATTEAEAIWETFTASKSVTLPTGDGLKTISIKLRDSVLNESGEVSSQITLDTAVPVVTITGPDVSVISKTTPSNVCSFSFIANEDFTEYKVKVVPANNSLESAGTLIPTTDGSVNMSGTDESGFPANTAINCSIKGADLQTASSADGTKIIKVFVKDMAGQWSIA